MLTGKYKCPPILYVAALILVLALIFLGAWSRYHTHAAAVKPPLHERK